jgi:hypothetical protein
MLVRSKVKYYGAYPGGFLERARVFLPVTINDPVLHVCGGKVREYPYPARAVGKHDLTLDLDPGLKPDFLQDARDPFPKVPESTNNGTGTRAGFWRGILADPPYSPLDAIKYQVGEDAWKKSGRAVKNRAITAEHTALPSARRILMNGLDVLQVGGRIGILHYVAPRANPDVAKFIACITVYVGFENRPRLFSVYERRK